MFYGKSKENVRVAFALILSLSLFLVTGIASYGMDNLLLADAEIVEEPAEQDISEMLDPDAGNDQGPNRPLTYLADMEGGQLLTLRDCINFALENGYTIRIAEQSIEIANESGGSAMARFLPDLSMNYSYTRLADVSTVDVGDGMEVTLGNLNTYRVGFNFSYPLYLGGMRSIQRRLNEASELSAEHRLDQAEALIEVSVIDTFCAARESFGGLAIQRASLAHFDEVLRTAQAQYDAGIIPLNDLLSVHVARNEAAQKEAEFLRMTETSQTTLNTLIGAEPGSRWTLLPIDYPILPIPFELETLNEWAIENRPELKDLQAQMDSLDASIDAIYSERMPKIDLTADFSASGSEPDFSGGSDFGSNSELSGGISIFWDLYDFGAADEQADSLREQKQLLEIRIDETRSAIFKDVEWAYLNMTTQLGNINLAAEGLTQSEEAFRVAQRRQEEGLGPMTDVLSAEAAYVRLSAGTVFYTHEYFRAVSQLGRATGMTVEDLLAIIEAGQTVE